MDNINKEKEYIKNLIYLNLQKKEISELMSKTIREDKYKIKLINKDIINGYLNPQLNEKIMKILNNQNKKASEFNDKDINNIIDNIFKEIKNDKETTVEELALDFLFPEELKVNDLELPTNFYIITEERFNKIFENKNNFTDFKTYDAYLGEEGIFMWIEGDMITNEKNESERQTKEYNKVMYYIENNNNDDLKINKIFLYKNEEELKEQLKIIIQVGKYRYFEERNIIKKKFGKFFNIINDGNIIGQYINILKKGKESKEGKEDKKGQEGNTLSIKSVNEGERIENEIESIKEKEGLTHLFLPHLLICFSKIKKLKKGLELEQKNKDLLKSLLEIIKFLDNNQNSKDIYSKINDFENQFVKKELIFKLSYPNDKKSKVFKNLIEMLLNEFHQEIYVEDKLNPKEKFEDLKNSTFIFNLFFGLKKIKAEEVIFNTIDINTGDTGNIEVKLEKLLYHYKFKPEKLVKYFPNVLILLIVDKNKLLKLPKELNLDYDNKLINKYTLRSCIQMDAHNFISFIINDKRQNFSKVSFDNEKKVINFENSNIDEINASLSDSYNICFYEIDVEDINNNDYYSEDF